MTTKKELKLKARLINPQIAEAVAKKIGKYNGTEETTDFFFTNPNKKIAELRLRKSKDEKEVKFKLPLSTKIFQENEEYDFKVDDATDFSKFLEIAGFKLTSILRKSSKIYEYEEISIRISKIENKGDYIELTMHCEKDFDEKDKNKMLDLLRNLGIAESYIDSRYYGEINQENK